MNVRTISQYQINVSDPQRAWRFYHEVFDMPDDVLPDGTETVTVAGKPLTFITVPKHEAHKDVAQPDFILHAHDRIKDVVSHLQNYWVPIIAGPTPNRDLQAIYINDFEGNLIEILERAK
ncbi:Lactoylglutathione lyase related lyase [Furfurilactobacillus rossiae]|uniref:VOC family protein n=1 Tax=Furfurilactobacillus rossiae TaxID=231049 RepID=UPI0015C10F07|nr:VOC family protein [Furfurilactobacillus rossiae]MCF6164653.1 VOC family protein [Furfurilactobacillus rossiae]QLE64941.1 Lactoylglutathione lyase related lyase [Furfurilactobacillus rossiae]